MQINAELIKTLVESLGPIATLIILGGLAIVKAPDAILNLLKFIERVSFKVITGIAKNVNDTHIKRLSTVLLYFIVVVVLIVIVVALIFGISIGIDKVYHK